MNNLDIVKGDKQLVLTNEEVRRFFDKTGVCTDSEIEFFIQLAQASNLNPFKREIYLIKYSKESQAQIVTGYEVYLKRAERSGKWGGFKAWTEGEIPNLVAKVEVRRTDWKEPLFHEVYFNEVAKQTSIWKTMPKYMVKKVAIAQALRWAFPDEIGGLPYTQDEIGIVPETELKEAHNFSDQQDDLPKTVMVSHPQSLSVEEVEKAFADKEKASTAQIKKIYAIFYAKKFDKENFNKYISEKYNGKKIFDLTKSEASDFISIISNEGFNI